MRFAFRTLCLLSTFGFASTANAGIHLDGSMSASRNAGLLQSTDYRSGSVSVSTDIFRYLRLGITHKQAFSGSEGWTVDDNGTDAGEDDHLVQFNAMNHIVANSLDLTIILYEGQQFMPYLIGGVVRKQQTYEVETSTGKQSQKEAPETMPSGGIGLGIMLSRGFTLKISYIVSPSTAYVVTGDGVIEKNERKLDEEMTVGLSYRL